MRLLFIFALLIGVFLRCYDLNNRPLHNDEGVNFHFLKEIEAKGYYPYSHENYHGPLYFYASNLFFNHVNEGVRDVYELRASAVLAGILIVVLPLAFFSGWQAVGIASLIAVSSGLVFYSRYAIHETLFVLLGGLFGCSLFRYLETGKVWFGYVAAVALALMIGTKETFIITLASISCAALIVFGPRTIYTRLWVDRRDLFWGAVLLWLMIVVQFTGGFRWVTGLNEMILAVPQWVSRNTSDYGHFKPFDYYLNVFFSAEPVLVLALCAACYVLAKGYLIDRTQKPASVQLYTAIWTISVFLVYSFVRYKTPWLLVNISVPALFLLGSVVTDLKPKARAWGLSALLFVSLIYTARFVFIVPFAAGNPFSYTHTSAGMVEVADKIIEYRKSAPKAMVLIAAAQYWPMPFYLRGHEPFVHYVTSNDVKAYTDRYEIIVIDKSVDMDIPGFTHFYSRISDVQECQIYMKKL
jgi:uncharacterized protein (TIGR03663 family)